MDISLPKSSKFSLPGRWLWLLPRLAFMLFVAGVGELLWISHQTDAEEQRATIISDMLWLEQNLRFQLLRNEELLGQINILVARDETRFQSNARALLTNGMGLRQVLWIDGAGKTLRAEPSVHSDNLVGEELGVVPSSSVSRLARAIGKPSYTAPYPVIENDWQFEVHVPIFEHGLAIGVAVGIYSMHRIIEESVPWWLAERYRISVKDNAGKQLVSRSKINPTSADAGYELIFDPPGHGLLLSATPYQHPLPVVNRLVAVALVLLAITVLVSLWILRRHVQHRLRAEDALRKEYSFRKAMDNSMQTGLRARDLQGKIIYVNSAFCRMVGWSSEELVGMGRPMPYWAEESIEETLAVNNRVLAGEGPDEGFELLFCRRSGERFTALIHEAPLIDENGIQTGWMGSVIDISDQKRQLEHEAKQQDRLQSTSRLVAMGEMASGLAHELNQPLAAISSYCSGALNMLRSNSDNTDVIPGLERAVEQAQRAGQIVRRVYSLARRSDGKLESVRLAERIETVIGLVESDFKRRSLVIVHAFDDAPVIQGDGVLIEQAIFNLLRNAGESMSGLGGSLGGVIMIRLWQDCGFAHLQVIDNGCGISPDAYSKLFDPLFTTKEEGLGMGLSICRSIAEYHKGRITVESNPEGGSIFALSFPVEAS